MNTVLVACETIEDEIKSALARLRLDYPVSWLEGGLHNTPELLRNRISDILRELEGKCDFLILALGYCGGGVSGLTTGGYTTILPLADDCISILLGSMQARKETSKKPTFYLTSGWLRHESNLVSSYQRIKEKYGEARADKINAMMLKHYERLGLVDTGTYDLSAVADEVGFLAGKLNLCVEKLPGNNGWLDSLLTGPYDDQSRFMIIPPNGDINFEQWRSFLENPIPVLK